MIWVMQFVPFILKVTIVGTENVPLKCSSLFQSSYQLIFAKDHCIYAFQSNTLLLHTDEINHLLFFIDSIQTFDCCFQQTDRNVKINRCRARVHGPLNQIVF